MVITTSPEPAFGSARWMGVFGAFVSHSITGEANR